MKDYINKLKEFNKAFNIKVEDRLSPPSDLRFKLMLEENQEYKDSENRVDVADAIGDMLYILCGTIVHHGLENHIEDLFNEIHRSNMSKLDDSGNPLINGENGVLDERKPLGKILKSKNFSEPDLLTILNK